MKIKLFLLTLLISIMSYAQYTAIPDANFENALSAHDDILMMDKYLQPILIH